MLIGEVASLILEQSLKNFAGVTDKYIVWGIVFYKHIFLLHEFLFNIFLSENNADIQCFRG